MGYAIGEFCKVRFPAPGQDYMMRDKWPWYTAEVTGVAGDEYTLTVFARHKAELEDGTKAPGGTPDDELFFPVVFRDASEMEALS